MRKIPIKQRNEMNEIPFFKVCAKAHLAGHECKGRITWDHPIIFAGQQVIDAWATVPVCEYGHGVDSFQDGGDRIHEVHLWIALSMATDADLRKISKATDYIRERDRLQKKYGFYNPALAIDAYNAILARSKIDSIKNSNGPTDVAMWYPVSKDLKQVIDDCIAMESKFTGNRPAPFKVIEDSIREYHNRFQVLVDENS